MELHVISIFPDMFDALSQHGVVGRAMSRKVLSLTLHNPRDYADDKRSTVDDRPYGGGPGMVMSAEPLAKAIAAAKTSVADSLGDVAGQQTKVVYLSPQGQRFSQSVARSLATRAARGPQALILLAGRYEGIDERLLGSHIDEEWSIGDYVLSGGELPAMIVIDAIARLLPDSLGNRESAEQDSFSDGLLDCPHYTRPEVYDGQAVPEVLLSGDHQAIERWRMKQSLGRTWLRRPELLNKLDLTETQLALLEEFKREL